MEKSEEPILQPVEKRYPDHQWLMKGALVTATLVGFGNAITRTWDLFYDNWKNSSLFSDLRKDREDAKMALARKVETTSMDYKEIREAQQTIENTWSKSFNKRLLARMGIESEGPWGVVKGTWQRFNSLGNHTQPKIIFGTVLTTAAAIGGYVLMNQNAHMKRDMRSMQDRLEEERRSNEQKPKER